MTPINDPTMVVEWFFNDQLLYSGSRISTKNDFGFITLFIKGVIPEDSGVYAVIAKNKLGEDKRQCTVIINSKESILSNTQHEDLLSKIEYLENLNKFSRDEVFDIESTVNFFIELLFIFIFLRLFRPLLSRFQMKLEKLKKVNHFILNAKLNQLMIILLKFTGFEMAIHFLMVFKKKKKLLQ